MRGVDCRTTFMNFINVAQCLAARKALEVQRLRSPSQLDVVTASMVDILQPAHSCWKLVLHFPESVAEDLDQSRGVYLKAAIMKLWKRDNYKRKILEVSESAQMLHELYRVHYGNVGIGGYFWRRLLSFSCSATLLPVGFRKQWEAANMPRLKSILETSTFQRYQKVRQNHIRSYK